MTEQVIKPIGNVQEPEKQALPKGRKGRLAGFAAIAAIAGAGIANVTGSNIERQSGETVDAGLAGTPAQTENGPSQTQAERFVDAIPNQTIVTVREGEGALDVTHRVNPELEPGEAATQAIAADVQAQGTLTHPETGEPVLNADQPVAVPDLKPHLEQDPDGVHVR